MARKFYVKLGRDYKINEQIIVDSEEFNHLKNVLRYSVGDSLTIIDGSGFDYFCKLISLNKDIAVLKILKREISYANPRANITVYQALVKGEKLELITQKLTQLGISKLVLFHSEFCQTKPKTTRIDRLKKISTEALKQSGRSKDMQISCNILNFQKMLNDLDQYDCIIFAYEKETQSMNLKFLSKKEKIALIIGSEGGFSKGEVKKLSCYKNVTTVSLGKRILRAETAAIALSTLALFAKGELS